MRRLLPLCALITLLAVAAVAGEPVIVPRDVLDAIVDDNPGPPLPRYATAEELTMPPLALPEGVLTPPAGEVDCPPEYALNDGLLIRWGDFNSVLTAMTVPITTGDPEAVVYILVSGSSQQSSATTTLTSAGADMGQVEFITVATNSVWIRDYGPRFISEDGQRAVVDHTYNRNRPLDNQVPDFIASLWGEASYDIGMTHGGGNFHLFGDDDAYLTELIVNENPTLTPAEIVQRYLDYQGLAVTITDPLPSWFDSTQHIDMWMLPTADREVIIGEYAAGSAANTVTETWAAELTSRGYTVRRTPGWSSGGTHYTYTNAVIFNDMVFIPWFSGYATENAQALAVFQAAFPGRTVIPVDCSSIIYSAGAIHCIVMHVPDVDPPFFTDGFETGGAGAWSAVVP